MSKFISFWLFLTINALIIMGVMYMFGDNDVDAVEDFTMEELLVLIQMHGTDTAERRAEELERLGVDTSEDLWDALDDKDFIENLDVVERGEREYAPGMFVSSVVVSFDYSDANFEIPFLVVDKSFFNFSAPAGESMVGPLASEVASFGNASVTQNGETRSIQLEPSRVSSMDSVRFFGSIFHTDAAELESNLDRYLR